MIGVGFPHILRKTDADHGVGVPRGGGAGRAPGGRVPARGAGQAFLSWA